MDSEVSFLAFCNLCDHLGNLHKVEQKKQKLSGFVEEWRRKDPASLFSFMRLLLPHLDNERENYGLMETKLADLYISALALPRDSHDAYSLQNWKQSKHKEFADVLAGVLKNRLDNHQDKRSKSIGHSTSIKDVNNLLDTLSTMQTADNRRDFFLKMTSKMSVLEQTWLIRIILKSLRLGLPDTQVLKLLHPEAPAVFDVRMNLKRVVEIFQDPIKHPFDPSTALKINLFCPFKPQLAEREHLHQINKLLPAPFIVEHKLDGERCQMHYSKSAGGNYRYWSRNGTEYTFLYGRDFSEGSLTPKIELEQPFGKDVESVVLDGEMVVFDPLLGKLLPFGTLKTSAGAKFDPIRSDSEPHPCLVVFDIVYLNGQSLLDWPLQKRLDLLKSDVLTKPIPGFLEIINRTFDNRTIDQVSAALDEAILDQVEGLILKDPTSPYLPARRCSRWIKIKPEYVEGLCDDLDLVAWYSRTANIKESYGKANAFLCGVWSDNKEKVFPFVKVGGGFNSQEWAQLHEKLEPLLVKSTPSCPFIQELHFSVDRPDLVVKDPAQSVVIQVKGSQIIPSTTNKNVGWTLRHPRFIRLRSDRSASSSLKISELLKLQEITAGTLARKEVSTAVSTITKKKTNRPKGKMTLAIERAVSDPLILKRTQIHRSFLKGHEVMVLNASDSLSKVEIEQKVVQAGGCVVQSPSSSENSKSFFVICGKDCGIRVKNLKALGKFDIISFSWLIECEKQGRLIPLKPQHMIFITPSLQSEFEKNIDKFGDSYIEDIATNTQLRSLLDGMESVHIDKESFESISNEFLNNQIELPEWSRGFGKIYPISKNCDPLFIKFLELKYKHVHGEITRETF